MTRERVGKTYRKVELASRRPSARDAHAGDGAVLANSDAGPEHFAGVVVDAATQIEQDMPLSVVGKRVAMDADAFGSCQLGMHSRILKKDAVVARFRMFVCMGESRAIARVRLVGIARLEGHLGAPDRHQQHVTEVAVAGAG